MLVELRVKNFAIIKDAKIDFCETFNVLTGETGAGKSLIVDALLALMGRGGGSFVRAGEDMAIVEAVFTLDEQLKKDLNEVYDEEFISIKKIIQANGKTRQYINDSFVTQAKVREILQKILHVYGQSEAKELYDASYHIELYDIYCDNNDLKLELKNLINNARTIKKELEDIEKDKQERMREIDFLNFQIEEIENAKISSLNEDQELLQKKVMLQNKEKILKGLSETYNLLYGTENSVYDLLSRALKKLSPISIQDKVIEESERELENIIHIVKNQAEKLNSYVSYIELEEDDINIVESRLDLLDKLKKKYGGTLGNVLDYCLKAKERLERLKNLDIEKTDLENKLNHYRTKILDLCKRISEKRHKFAVEFANKIENELKELGMPKSVFKVVFKEIDYTAPEEITYNGGELVEFYFASHKGEPAKPLNTVASGGELSRIMLAIKNAIPKERKMTVIFDEVDSGIGGKTGEMLGKKLYDISKHHQVICITHLPQVAVWAEKHMKVLKDESGDRVIVNILELKKDDKIEEIARMFGGNLSEKGLEYAKELINRVCEAK